MKVGVRYVVRTVRAEGKVRAGSLEENSVVYNRNTKS